MQNRMGRMGRMTKIEPDLITARDLFFDWERTYRVDQGYSHQCLIDLRTLDLKVQLLKDGKLVREVRIDARETIKR